MNYEWDECGRDACGPGGITDYGLRITDYGLRITDYRLRITDYGLRITDYGLRITDYGLRIWAWAWVNAGLTTSAPGMDAELGLGVPRWEKCRSDDQRSRDGCRAGAWGSQVGKMPV
jgi:hypothetical protein